MRYLLDTNACIVCLRRKPSSVVARLRGLRPDEAFNRTLQHSGANVRFLNHPERKVADACFGENAHAHDGCTIRSLVGRQIELVCKRLSWKEPARSWQNMDQSPVRQER